MLAVNSKTAVQTASTVIFGSMLFVLFQSSALYHAMVNETAKKVFRKFDHSAIFMLIAGTYTPILLLTVEFPLSVAYVCYCRCSFSLFLHFRSIKNQQIDLIILWQNLLYIMRFM